MKVTQYEWISKQEKLLETIKDTYKWAINNDIAKEQARAVLPEGITMSRMYMNGTLRSWIHYIDLRSGHGTQKSIWKLHVRVLMLLNLFIR